MDKITKELLILIEIVIDEVNLEFTIQKQIENFHGDTCVLFQFLDNSPISICEADFTTNKRNFSSGCGGCSSLKNGKSCLFSLTPEQVKKCMEQFNIYVEVIKQLTGNSGEKLQLGESLISILKPFKNMIESYIQNVSTNVKSIKDCFRLTNSTNGDLVGSINVYIRLSCFGKFILTQFQMNFDTNCSEFKNGEGHYMLRNKNANYRNDIRTDEDAFEVQPEVEPPNHVSITDECDPFCTKYQLKFPGSRYQEEPDSDNKICHI